MKTGFKTVPIDLESIPSDGSGLGRAIVYTFGAPDQEPIFDSLYITRKGLTLFWAHDYERPIGKVSGIDIGPTVTVDFALDLMNTKGLELYEQWLRGYGPQEFSVGYAYETADLYKAADGKMHLKKAEVIEVSVVPFGASRSTELLEIKSLEGTKVGRSISASTAETLRGAYDALGSLLGLLEEPAEAEPETKSLDDAPSDEADEVVESIDPGIQQRQDLARKIRLLEL